VAWSGLVLLWAAALALPAASPGWLREALRLLLPAGALALPVGAAIGRAAEAGIRNIRSEPFVLAMRARGFPEGWRMDGRLLRATLAPVLALAGLEAAFLLGGTMVTEVVFARPGVGRLLVDSILGGDYPVVQVLLPLAALGYVFFGLIADWGAALADPRVRDAS
jgi:ABC-type dipeptide/oligopeptide/nickel transport system permease component